MSLKNFQVIWQP